MSGGRAIIAGANATAVYPAGAVPTMWRTSALLVSGRRVVQDPRGQTVPAAFVVIPGFAKHSGATVPASGNTSTMFVPPVGAMAVDGFTALLQGLPQRLSNWTNATLSLPGTGVAGLGAVLTDGATEPSARLSPGVMQALNETSSAVAFEALAPHRRFLTLTGHGDTLMVNSTGQASARADWGVAATTERVSRPWQMPDIVVTAIDVCGVAVELPVDRPLLARPAPGSACLMLPSSMLGRVSARLQASGGLLRLWSGPSSVTLNMTADRVARPGPGADGAARFLPVSAESSAGGAAEWPCVAASRGAASEDIGVVWLGAGALRSLAVEYDTAAVAARWRTTADPPGAEVGGCGPVVPDPGCAGRIAELASGGCRATVCEVALSYGLECSFSALALSLAALLAVPAALAAAASVVALRAGTGG